jgi:coatomer protein complex subunit alpha (xenin)
MSLRLRVLGLQMQVKRKEVKDDTVQQQELAAYFNNCNPQKVHLRLALLNTVGVCYKGGNFSTAANFV